LKRKFNESGRRAGRARFQRDRGGTLVEFAVVAPLLFLLLFGVIEFARIGHGFNTVWTAAREGARYATTVGNDDGDAFPNYLDCASIEEAALAKVVGMSLDPGAVDIIYHNLTGTAVADCDPASPLGFPAPDGAAHIDNGFTIEVTVSGEFNAIVPVISTFLDGIDLDSTQTRSIFMGVVGE
jgi:Flp pilus assembly protein TadG